MLVMKGAPERVIKLCTTALIKGQEVHVSEKTVEKAITSMAYMGERVLAFADFRLSKQEYPRGYNFTPEQPNFPMTNLRFVGLFSMIDPPRDAVPNAIAKCKQAGIRVTMVTGDHPITAMIIAKKVGIITSDVDSFMRFHSGSTGAEVSASDPIYMKNSCIVTGNHLRNMAEETLTGILVKYDEIVFARTSPQQKLQIVEAFQKLGEIVAVTGDGVNDSPALKKSDIGIAMGIAGTDVTKEAADIILLDDNFSTIVNGIEEGRLIFDNLKKSIVYALTTNVPEIVPFIAFIIFNVPKSLSVMTIIAINTGTDLWPAISLGYEKAEADIMIRKPRHPQKDNLVTGKLLFMTYGQIGVIQACASFACFYFIMASHGFFPGILFGMRMSWDSPHVNDLEDSYGQEWTYEERRALSKKCYAAFFMAIVITQIADVLICKTRKLSLFQQGMSNWVLNIGILFEVGLAIAIIYTPGLNHVFEMAPIEWYVVLPAVPFALLIFIYDECRKLLIRRYPGGWIERDTYY